MTEPRSPSRRSAGLPNPLPTELAFVVQFGVGTGPTDAIAAGRIEHVVSGRQRRFASEMELLTALREMAAEAAPQSKSPERTS